MEMMKEEQPATEEIVSAQREEAKRAPAPRFKTEEGKAEAIAAYKLMYPIPLGDDGEPVRTDEENMEHHIQNSIRAVVGEARERLRQQERAEGDREYKLAKDLF